MSVSEKHKTNFQWYFLTLGSNENTLSKDERYIIHHVLLTLKDAVKHYVYLWNVTIRHLIEENIGASKIYESRTINSEFVISISEVKTPYFIPYQLFYD